ncbi:ATP synthase F1 subunit delta [Macrococcus hajekii]|uniref:ATP synthase subunit delta n=1 Tax=Macrococcus hajekii TaxID=198482 RepID=A0A4R6BHW9_9STAP|nr:ATP synthase F1 subunit delta [Macrococcus hajekii]TDM01104.1 ATP synthase F1 subunit delta [Macrococcus hajekii]GGB12373.1 ATP synthase subunit delta [Macrococcus hajekii]
MVIAQKYAESLFEVSHDQGVEQSVKKDLDTLKAVVASDDAFKRFAEDPQVSKDARIQFVDETFKGVDPPLINLLKILAERQHLELIPAIAAEYEQVYNEANEQQYMKVESVYALSDEEIDSIGKAFIKRTGYKRLLIENIINKELIGGIRTTIGTTVYDGSVQNNLKEIAKAVQQH